MVLRAVWGAIGFLTRLPIGTDEAAWTAFRRTPVSFVLAAYPIGVIIALPVGVGVWLVPGVEGSIAALLMGGVIGLTGVNHADGIADLGDAAVVHGDRERRRAVMKDTTVGVGAVLALTSTLIGLALAGLALANCPPLVAVGLIVAAEVGTKLGLAAIACLGTAAHEGLGSAVTTAATPRELFGPLIVALVACGLTGRSLGGATAAVTGLCTGLAVLVWARRTLGGVSGDVFGGANELGRVLALHAGVIAWTLS
ncbi:adenosylcobinamide-GDP ribazoletransferase [Halocatena pleomorpha]|uniref:Adenosylcobinamide-GDP ribazoletransferase n=1 Tax=Halocatena pleomorpha TaxID=1785090 RepID=A0A3P3RGG5_9EURY|nr:adenosylcobinamide-GDP ribazoletransferase [Halocatena pleomorpha]RRJ32501.1 adenosylcobinamide-GDP ribazoletransferase [Halocatena pleomorpha]